MTVALGDFLALLAGKPEGVERAVALGRELVALDQRRASIVAELAELGIHVESGDPVVARATHLQQPPPTNAIPRPAGGYYRCAECGKYAVAQHTDDDWYCTEHLAEARAVEAKLVNAP